MGANGRAMDSLAGSGRVLLLLLLRVLSCVRVSVLLSRASGRILSARSFVFCACACVCARARSLAQAPT